MFLVAMLNPPWEAPDENFHVQNVETLVGGHWYRIEPGAGLEPHQPPLYYLLLAALQKVSGVPTRATSPVNATHTFYCVGEHDRRVIPLGGRPLYCDTFRHNLAQESGDKRLVRLLRIPSVVFGIGVLLLTGAVARRLSKDPWTPFVAAAFVAGVPGFIFVSAIVNNDGLVNLLSAAAVLSALVFVRRAPTTTREGAMYAAGLGALLGLLLLTKLYGPAAVITVIVAIWLAARNSPNPSRLRFNFAVIAGVALLVVSAWWLLQNQRWYGDALALSRTHDYLAPRLGLGAPRHYGASRIILHDVLPRLWETFYYNSAIGKLLWFPLIACVLCLALPGRRALAYTTGELVLVGSAALGGALALVIVALQTSVFRVSTAYLGLPALACLAALGLERVPINRAVRLLVPIVGCTITLVILVHNVIVLPKH
jgi:hypothetical protein